MIDKLFFVVLVLNATGLFRFVAPQFGVSIGHVSLALLALNVSYLVVKTRYSIPILLQAAMGGWLFVLVLWPLLTILYAPSFEIREIGLLLYYFSLFFGTVVYTVANGLPAMYRVMSVSLVVTILGMPLSMLMPQYFEAVGALAEAKTVEMGRPIGFFMQPNRLAISFGFLFIGWFSLWRRKNTSLEVVAILAFLFVMLLTGSRTGVLMAVITVTFILTYSWRKRFVSGRYLLKMGVLVACLAGGIIGTSYYLSNVGSSQHYRKGDLMGRMETMLSFRLTSDDGGVIDDNSVQARFRAQAVYLSLVKEKPLLGYGFGSDTYFYQNGIFYKTAHCEALAFALEYGVLYPFAFALLMLQLCRRRNRRDVETLFQSNSILQFVIVLLFLFVITGGLLGNRTFYVIWGMFFAAVYCPRYVFSYEETTGTISACMTRRDISKRLARPRRTRKPSGAGMSAECGIAEEGAAHT